jgi:formate-nitrite transporter family protein
MSKETELDKAPADIDAEEQKKAVEEEGMNASVTHEAIRREGVKELHRAPAALAWSGLAGGLAMGLSLLTQAVLHHGFPETTWRPLVVALGYAIGFLAITLGSQQLYTENTITPIVPLMAERTGEMLRKVLTLWAIVLITNLAGTFLFALAAARTAIFSPEVRHAMRTLALEAMSHDATTVFASAIVAGWIIALMIWMLPAASHSQVVVVVVMTWLVGAAKLSHVIVGSVDAFYLTVLGDMSVGRAFAGYIVPALLGNTLGGLMLVAGINHAQVKAG